MEGDLGGLVQMKMIKVPDFSFEFYLRIEQRLFWFFRLMKSDK